MRKWNSTSILTPLNYPKLMAEKKLTLYCSGLNLVDGCLRYMDHLNGQVFANKISIYSGNLTSPTTFIFFFLFNLSFTVFFIFIVFFFIFFIFSSSKQQLQPRRWRRQRSQPEPTQQQQQQQQQQQHIVYEHKRLGWSFRCRRPSQSTMVMSYEI